MMMQQQRQFQYPLIGVIGDRGDGKTTWAVRYLKMEMNLPEKERIYKKAFTNLHYQNSPEITHTNYAGIKLLDEANKQGVPEVIVHLDQIHLYADAMNWNTKECKEFIDTLVESRQHGFDMVVTTWAMTAVHPRLRKFINLWVQAKKKADGFHYDYFDVQLQRFITPPNGLILKFKQAESVWGLFATGELVKDDTLTKIAYAQKDERMDVARSLAIYEKCG